MKRGPYAYSPRYNSRGVKNHNTTLEQSDYPLILDLLVSGFSHSQIAEKFDVSKATIARISTGEHWLCRRDDLDRSTASR